MELSELSFKVNTEQLAAAVSLLGQVEQATNRLAVAQKNQSTAATSASGAIDSQAEAIKKLDTAQNETSQGSDKLQKSTKATSNAADTLSKSTEEVSSKLKKLKKDSDDAGDSVDPLAKLIQNLKDKNKDLAYGFTSGESAILKQARSYGAMGDTLTPVTDQLETMRKLLSEPFDASIGALRRITNEYEQLQQRAKLASEGISLTTKQLYEYSRLSNEISGKIAAMDLDPKAGEGLRIYNEEIQKAQSQYIKLAESTNATKEAERQLNNERRKAEREKITADREAEKARLKAEQDLVKSQENAQSALIDSLNRVSGLKAKAEQADAKLAIQVAKDTAREQALIREQVAMNNAAAMKQRISSLYSTPLTSASAENKLQAISDQGGYVDSMARMKAFYTEQDKLMKASQVAKDTAREQALILEQVAMNNAAAMKQRIGSLYATPLTSASSENKLQAISDQGGYVERMQAMRAFYTEQDKLMKASQGMNDQAVALFYKNQAVQSKGSDAVTKSLREQERATKWLANEDERMVSVVNTLTTTQNLSNAASEKAARSIANYERNLRQAGVTGVEAAKSLDNYRKQQELIQTQEESRKGKFLSRALQPQIGDVVVSLAAGQNPLTVMLQQGDQVRGLIAQSGIEGTKLSAIMRAAFTDTLVSVKDTAKAMSQVLGGAFLSVGKLVTDLAVGPIKAFTTSLEFSKAYGDSGPLAFLYAMKNSVAALGASFAAFSTAGIVAAVAGLATLGVALYQVTKQEDEVSRVMALHGGAMGLTRGSAVALAQSFNGLGVSTYKALDALSEMATVGGFVQADAQKVVEAAVKMEKAGGPAIAETIKMFSSIKEKPVEALIKLGETSGLIAPQILEEVSKLSITGHMGDAIALALDTAVGVVKKQTAEMTRELSAFGTLLKDIGNAWTTLMDKFRGAMYKDDAITVLQDKITALKSANNWSVGSTSNNNSTINNLEEQLKLMKRAQNAEYDRNQENLAYNSRQSAIFNDKKRLTKWLEDEEDKIGKKKLSREDFIAKALEDQVKLRGELKDLTEKEQASIKRVAGLSFDKLHEKDNKSGESKYQTQLKAALGLTDSAMNKNEGLLSETTKFYEAVNFLRNKARKEDRISADTEQAMLDAFLNRQPFMIAARKDEADAAKEKADGLKLIDSLIGKADFMGSAYYETLKKLNDLEGKPGIDVDKLKEARAALEETTPSAKAFASVMAEYTKSIAEVNATSVNLKSQYSTDFILPDNRAKLKAQEEYLKKVQIINAEYDKKIEYNKAHIDELRRDKANAGAKDEADVKKRLAQETYDREVYLVSESYKVNKEYSDQIIKLGQDVSTQLTNQFMDFAMFGKSSFEGLAVSFDKMINNMINNLLRFHAQQKIQGILDAGITAGLDAVGLSSGVSAASALGTASSVSSGMSMLNNAGAWVTDFGSSVAKAMGSAGDKFYSLGLEKLGLAMGAGSTGAMSVATSGSSLAAMGGGTGMTLGAAGTTGLTLGGGAGGVGLQGVAAGTTGAATSTFSTMASYAETAGEIFGYLNTAMLAGSGKWGAAIGAGLGTYFGGPLGSFIGGKIGGWVDNAFGGGSEYTTSQGISGKFSKNGFQGRNYQDWKNDGSSGFFGIGASGSSSGTNYSAMDTALQDKLSAAFTAIQIQTAGFAGALGANADSILNYTQDIKLALGNDASANKTAIENLFKDIANNTASTILDPKYIKEGETATDALTRLATSLSQVNKVTTLLGGTLLQLSQMSADSADKLITLMGGQAAFTSAMDSYYTTYYTEEERLASSKADVTKELAKLNLVMPDTLAGYKDLVNSQDKTTESGRQAYAALIKLSPEFAKFTSAVDALQTSSVSAAKSIKALIDSLTVERTNVASAVNTISPSPVMTADQLRLGVKNANLVAPDLDSLNLAKSRLAQADNYLASTKIYADQKAKEYSVFTDAKAAFTKATSTLKAAQTNLANTPSTIMEHYTYQTLFGDRGGDREVYNPAYGAAVSARDAAQKQVDLTKLTWSSVSNNGVLSESLMKFVNDSVQDALKLAVTNQAEASSNLNATQIKYNAAVKAYTVDAARSVGVLGKLREETVKYYESQKALSDLMLNSASNLRTAINTARGTQLTSSQSLVKQQSAFSTTYTSALTSTGSAQAGYADKLTAALPSLTSALADTAATRSDWAIATSQLFAQSDSIATLLEANAPKDYQAESLAILGSIDSILTDIGDATQIISSAVKAGAGLTAAGLREVVTALGGTPAFTTGGMHSGGLRLVGENGPELEVTGPSRIFNADQTRSMLSGNRGNSMDTSRLEALVEKQAHQLEAMRYELQAIATSSGKTANILQRVTPDGNSLQTAVAV